MVRLGYVVKVAF